MDLVYIHKITMNKYKKQIWIICTLCANECKGCSICKIPKDIEKHTGKMKKYDRKIEIISDEPVEEIFIQSDALTYRKADMMIRQLMAGHSL